MAHRTISSGPSDGLHLPWSWCARCQRAYPTGTGRVIRFRADALHPHPATLTLCPYLDCSANALRDGWRWATIQGEHPDYPLQPERNVVYVRGGIDSSQAHSANRPQRVGARSQKSERQALVQEEEASMPTTPSETTVVELGGTLKQASVVDMDPALTEQLALAADMEPVEVVLVLRQSGVDTDQHAEAETLIRQAAANVPLGAVEYSLLPQLGVLIARAPAQLIRWLITQPAVVVASANRVAGSADGAPLAGHASNVLRSTPVGQECAALKDELARVFGRITLEHRYLAGWEDDGGTVAAATERAPQ